MEPKNKDAGQYSGWWLLAIAALGVILCALLFFGFEWTSGRKDIDKLGQMGDFFGGMLNPLVSALTLFVAISVWQLQKKELKATQKALDEQAKTAEQQRQEQRFFDLLNVYQRTVDSISHSSREKVEKGTEALVATGKAAVDRFLTTREDDGSQGRWSAVANSGMASWAKNVAGGYQSMENRTDCTYMWKSDGAQFEHYFRVIHHILTEAEALLSDQHIRYIKLFRAQLSRSELIILGFHLWLDDEGKKMLPLAEKYGLLKHLPNGHFRTELEKLHPKVFGYQPKANL